MKTILNSIAGTLVGWIVLQISGSFLVAVISIVIVVVVLAYIEER